MTCKFIILVPSNDLFINVNLTPEMHDFNRKLVKSDGLFVCVYLVSYVLCVVILQGRGQLTLLSGNHTRPTTEVVWKNWGSERKGPKAIIRLTSDFLQMSLLHLTLYLLLDSHFICSKLLGTYKISRKPYKIIYKKYDE